MDDRGFLPRDIVAGITLAALALVLSLLGHVRRHYDPHDAVLIRDQRGAIVGVPPASDARLEPGLVVYRFGVGLFYANAARSWEEILALVDVRDPPRWLVLLAPAMDDVDFTGGKTLIEVGNELAARGITFAIAEVNSAVLPELDRFGVTALIGSEHVYATLDEAIASFRAP